MSESAGWRDLREPPAERRDRIDKVAERIARRILRDIIGRGLEPGMRLPPEAAMLARYDVGRASLREGLRILEVYGLIRIKPGPGGGPMVAEVSSQDFGRGATFFYHAAGATLHELVETRVFVEPLMARLAAERLTVESAARLRTVLKQEEHGLGGPAASGHRHSPFHNVIASMSGNRVLGLFGQSLVDIYMERIKPVFPAASRRSIQTAHGGIAEAILAGHTAKAESLMRDHIQDVASHFLNHFLALVDEVIDWR